MKKIKLDISSVVMPTGYTIDNVHFELNGSELFDQEVILDLVTSDTSVMIQHTFLNDEVIYGRVTVTFTNGEIWKSNTLSITGESKFNSDIQVYPPRLNIRKVVKVGDKSGSLSVKIDPPIFFKGNGTWLATTWIVRDIAGNEIFKREYDTVDKTVFELPLRYYENTPAVIIEAKYEFEGCVTVSRGMATFITMADEQSFGITNYLIISKENEVPIGIIDNKYEVETIRWNTTNSEGFVLERGVGDIVLNGPIYRGLDNTYLHIALDTINHGTTENTFVLEVTNENIGFPLTLPYEGVE